MLYRPQPTVEEITLRGSIDAMLPAYCVSARFFKLLFAEERGVEPLLIVDQNPDQNPQRMFLVRYVVGEGGGWREQAGRIQR